MNYTYLIISTLLGFIIQYSLKFLESKSRFVIWLSHKYEFNIPNPDGSKMQVYVQTVRLDNLGKLSITDVEIVHKTSPDFFAFDPPQPYEESTLPDGSHLIYIKSIAPHSGFSMQYFCYAFYPNVTYIRSKQGYAEVKTPYPSFALSKWKLRTLKYLVIIGISTSIYWLIQLTTFLINHFFPVGTVQ